MLFDYYSHNKLLAEASIHTTNDHNNMPAKVNPHNDNNDECQQMNLTLRTTTKWRFRISFRRTRKADRSKALKNNNNETREIVMPIKIMPTREEEEEEERKRTVMTEDMQMFKNIIEMVLQKEGFRPL